MRRCGGGPARIVSTVLAVLASGAAARADFKVRTPDVNLGEWAVETVGDAGFDADAAKSGAGSDTIEVQYGLTGWWQTELELAFERDPGPGMGTRFTQVTSENIFLLTEPGKSWADAGLFAEYGQTLLRGHPNEITLGPILRKAFWGLTNTVNLLVEKDLGRFSSGKPRFLWAWETRIDAWRMSFGDRFTIEPGFQYYGEPGTIGQFGRWKQQDNRAGPQLFGAVADFGPGALEWNAGFLVGLTRDTPLWTARWQLEYDIRY